MPFADHHDLVKAFPSNRSNHGLGIGVLPERAWRNDRFADVQRLGLTLSAIYENGFSVKAHLLIPAPPVDGAAGPVSPSLLAMVAGVARRSRGPSQDSTIHLSAHVGA